MTATSTIAIDDEVRDQGQRFSLLRRREGFQRGFCRPRVPVRLGQGVLDPLVLNNVAPDLVDLLGVEGMTLSRLFTRSDSAGVARASIAMSGKVRFSSRRSAPIALPR